MDFAKVLSDVLWPCVGFAGEVVQGGGSGRDSAGRLLSAEWGDVGGGEGGGEKGLSFLSGGENYCFVGDTLVIRHKFTLL